MKLLFLGESWMGSSARSLKESLQRIVVLNNDEIDEIDEMNEDLYIPKAKSRWLRVVHRILTPAYRNELAQALIKKCNNTHPDVLLVYKGQSISVELLRSIKAMGIFTVNIFPDYSPHAYGTRLRQTIGEYDLVISTKPFHPDLWESMYGYTNPCVFVPHGYDALVHLRTTLPTKFNYDIGLVATWRPEYHDLMCQVASLLAPHKISVAIAGNGWADKTDKFPGEWVFTGEIMGAAYSRWAQQCKIMIAPVNRDVVIGGQRQPGDEDSTRTYELAAANCFFIHRRTDYIHSVYDNTEVPFFDDAAELVKLALHFLTEDDLRQSMAAAAHTRAVPAYSIDKRAEHVLTLIRTQLGL